MDKQRSTRPAAKRRDWPAPGKRLATSAPGPAKPSTAETDGDHPHQNPFPIVGVGASASGLEAFKDLLRALPADTGMAYVLVQHLDPHHESTLAELLSRATPMPVVEVKEDTPVAPNRVYVIPPLHDIGLENALLKLVPRTQTRGRHMPIDYFLRSLAAIQGSKAIGVILSGTASDGTLGLKAIKEEGGITFAQEPRSAQYDGMPRSAMASGCVDLVLTPKRIARELARLGRHPYVATRAAAGPDDVPISSEADHKDSLRTILALLKKATGADFSLYKLPTIRRRIARRMAIHHIETREAYARHLEGDLEELQALQQDCLITVTSFFRDPQAFQALSEQVFPRLLKDRPADAPIRVWVPGCATGEEVYSLVICLLERAGELASNAFLQVFATDLSEHALEKARTGRYLQSIAQDVSSERLRRFFSRVDGQYQVNKTLREMCVFARHDLVKDPPFSRVQLVSCRNLLIYLETRWQERVLATFHYALNPTGCLMLGPSETVGAASALFEPLGDAKHRIYSRRPGAPPPFLTPGAPPGERADGGALPARITPRAARRSGVPREADRILLARYAPAGVLVDERLMILEFRGDTQPYLEHAHGQASLDLMKMARKGLLLDLRQAVEEARRKNAPARRERVHLYPGQLRTLNLQVIPVKGPVAQERCLLVLFEDVPAAKPRPAAAAGRKRPALDPDVKDRQLAQLQQDLAETRQYLGTVMEEHEAAYEELQSSHEEILSSNEELQSVNEELGTAKEEIQSANEELSTLNQELEDRNARLERLNDDLLNLLGSVNIPIVMVGRDLRVRRFTTAAEKLFNLIPSDVGRPLGDIRSNLEGIDVEREVLQVIDSLHSSEREVQDRHGRFHAMRIRPYLTVESRIEGAVLALVDIDSLKRSGERIRTALDYANAIVSTVREPLLILDQDLRVERASSAFYENFRVSAEQTEGRLLYELGDGQWNIPALRTALEEVLPEHRSIEGFEVEHDFPEIGRRTMVLNARRLRREDGQEERILLAIQDRTEIKRAEEERETLLALEQGARSQAEADRLKEEFLATVSHELRGPLTTMLGWIDLLRGGRPDETTLARGLAAIDRGVTAQARLIEDLLDHSLMLAGKLRLSGRLIDIVPIAEAAAESLRPAAGAKQIRIEVLRETASATVRGDPDRLQQVAWNLLSNAVKFTPHGGRIEISIGRVDERIQLRVSDSGVGIRPAFLPHVFDRFRQADGSSTRSQPGLGLGLAIVRQLVELHEGTVRAESPGEGRGATFTVALPIPDERIEFMGTEGEEPAAIATAFPGQDGAGPGPALLHGVNVLLVEDDTDARETLAMVLEQCGAQVTSTASAGEAMRALERTVPDVLVSDIKMVGEDGYDLIRQVRGLPQERGGRIPALALTAYAGAQHARKALAAGFEAHVAKPAAAAELVTKVARLTGRARDI